MILTITALKGGTGKTTTALALSQAAAADGRRVLLIDLDAQCNLSWTAGAAPDSLNSMDLLNGENAENCIQKIQDIYIIPGNKNLLTEQSSTGSGLRLRNALRSIKKKFDLIAIDTPSLFGELVFNALLSTDSVVIPLKADTYSLQGLQKTLDTIALIRDNGNRKLKTLGVVLNEYNSRTTFGGFIATQLQHMPKVKLLGTVRRSIAIQEAQNLKRSIFEYKPKCSAAQDFLKIYKALPLK